MLEICFVFIKMYATNVFVITFVDIRIKFPEVTIASCLEVRYEATISLSWQPNEVLFILCSIDISSRLLRSVSVFTDVEKNYSL